MAALGIGGIDPSLLPPYPACLIRFGRDNRHQFTLFTVSCAEGSDWLVVGPPILRRRRFVKYEQRQSTTAV